MASADEKTPAPRKLTADLLEQLLASSSVESYLDETPEAKNESQTLAQYLNELLEARPGLKKADVIRASGLNGTVVYDVFAGKITNPSRDRALMLAFGMGASLRETQRILRLDNVPELRCKDRRDAAIIWCLEKGLTRAQADDELYRLSEKTLLGTGRLK